MQQNEKENLNEILNSFEDINELKKILLSMKSQKQKSLEDWRHELDTACKLGFFPNHCKNSAFNFGCCAVGARLQIENPGLARKLAMVSNNKSNGKIASKFLSKKTYDLGVEFYEEVANDNPYKAKEIFNEIQNLPSVFKTVEEKNKEWKGMKYYLKKIVGE